MDSHSRTIVRLADADIRRLEALPSAPLSAADVVRELVENALDANATRISVSISVDGVNSQICVLDDGEGIVEDDLPFVCRRFCTSRGGVRDPRRARDSLGFGGESLYYISRDSTISLVTRSALSEFAVRAVYGDGSLLLTSVCAGTIGSWVVVEKTDRFRVLSQRNTVVEISGVMRMLAVHFAEVSFSFRQKKRRRHIVNTPMLRKLVEGNAVRPDLDGRLQAILKVFGRSLMNALAPVKVEFPADDEKWSSESDFSFFVDGWVSRPTDFVETNTEQPGFFVNDHIVEWPTLQRALYAIYSSHFRKNVRPFLYLSIAVPKRFVRFKVNSRKRLVCLFNEDVAVRLIRKRIEGLLGVWSSRSRVVVLSPITREDVICVEERPPKPRKSSGLSSARRLSRNCQVREAEALTSLLRGCALVGSVDDSSVIVQFQTKVLVLDMEILSKELFYQLGLDSVGNFASHALNPPLAVKDLEVEVCYDCPRPQGTAESVLEVSRNLCRRIKALSTFFGVGIEERAGVVSISSVPLLIESWPPSMDGVFGFLSDISVCPWEREIDTVECVVRALASWMSKAVRPREGASMEERLERRRAVRDVLFPICKTLLQVPSECCRNGAVIELCNIQFLHRLFRR